MFKWLLVILLLIPVFVIAQSKYLAISTPGTLSNLISSSEKKSITTLTLSGSIDARDFVFLRDQMFNLSTLNIGNVSIKEYVGVEGSYKNTDTIYQANSIPDYAFYDPTRYLYKSSLKSIIFPASLVSIGKQAFYFSWNLAGTLTLPTTVIDIGDLAFYGCYAIEAITTTKSNTRYSTSNGILYSKLADTVIYCPNAKTGTVDLPTTVKHIHSSAFENCYNLNAVNLPSSLLSIGKYGFANCSGITGNLDLPINLNRIGKGAFYSCYNLNGSVNMPASLKEVGAYCFLESNSIVAFNIQSSNNRFASMDGSFYSKNLDTLFICPPKYFGNFVIPESVKLIGSHAFYNCSDITGSIEIPSGVDYIGYYAFYGTKSLNNFSVNSQNEYFSSSENSLYSKDKTRLLAVPALKSGNINFENALKQIDPGALNNCNLLTGELLFSSELEWIGAYAFYNCTGISGFRIDENNKNFTSQDGIIFNKTLDTLWICPLSKSGTYNIPETVTYIGTSAFDGCNQLNEIVLPSNLKEIDSYAFEYCTNLSEITLPSTVDSIGNGTFYSCTNLKTINAHMINPPIIDYYVFDLVDKANCSLNIPKNTITIYSEAPYWNEFTKTSDFLFNTENLELSESKLRYKLGNNAITIETTPGDQIKLYNIQGQLILDLQQPYKISSYPFTGKGIFILEIKGLTEKIRL